MAPTVVDSIWGRSSNINENRTTDPLLNPSSRHVANRLRCADSIHDEDSDCVHLLSCQRDIMVCLRFRVGYHQDLVDDILHLANS